MSKDKDHQYTIGFDLGGTKMLAAAFDEDFKIVATHKKKTKAYKGLDDSVGRIVDVIRSVLDGAGAKKKQLTAIGIGSPGPLNLNDGVILQAPNLGWENVPLKQIVEEEFECSVVVANDVDTGTFGEYRFGAGINARCVVGVFPGTGIGGGCVYRGKVLRGSEHSCLEIGHIILQPQGPLCGCGQRGCLEALASRLAIASQAAAAAHRGLAPHLLDIAGTDIGNIRSSALAESIEKGDTVVQDIVRSAARWLGLGIANVVNLLAPDVVILGGGLVERMPDIYLKEVKSVVLKRSLKTLTRSVRFEIARLGGNAVIMGAAAIASEEAKDQGRA